MTAPLATPALRAVVVDDTPDLRELLCLALESGGEFQVVGEAGNGLEGIARVRQTRPDVVLLDLAMPVMDGLEALPQIRQLCPDATIIVLSGFGASAMASRAVAAGADGYLEKGASVATILDYVRGLVGHTSQPELRILAAPSPAVVETADLEVAFDLAPDGVLVLDDVPELDVLAANPRACELLGLGLQAGDRLVAVAPELARLVRRLSASDDAVAELRLGRPQRPMLVTQRHTAGRILVYLHQRDDPGGVEMLRRAIATTAHEIRTPVTVLLGVAEALRDRGDNITPELQTRLGEAVVRQARRLDSMTSDLLTAAQVHRGTLQVTRQRVPVQAVIDAVLEVPVDGLRVEGALDEHLLGEQLRIEQMVGNLLGNAVKYGAAPFAIRVRPSGEEVHIDVVDRGPGVPPEFEPDLFEEFTRAEGTSARGTGLGLYVVWSLAVAHGGGVSYTRSPDGESVFTLALPRG
ncbi:MAG TPA: response regulator [Nocardioidaceae bacterium]|nr:response regulator [Nocardioidaceae bacterium]